MLELVVAAILVLNPGFSPNYAKQFARPIVSATNNLEDALILVTTINHESSFLRAYAICEKTGDEGRAIGSYQLHWYHWGRYTKEQICKDPKIQTKLTIIALGKGSAEERWSRFMGRDPTNHEIQRRIKTLTKLKETIIPPQTQPEG